MKQTYQFSDQDLNGLSLERVVAAAPSVLAMTAHQSRSDKYLQIPTIELIEGLGKRGYVPIQAMQSMSKLPDGTAHARHLLRLQHEKYFGVNAEEVPNLLLTNDSMGKGAYLLMLGFIRFVCTNGTISGDINTTLRVPHKGNVIENVFTASYTIAEEAETTMRVVAQMKRIQLSYQEQLTLAKYAASERFGIPVEMMENVVEGTLAYNPVDLLKTRRDEDKTNILWDKYNVIEENARLGGVLNHKTHRESRMVTAIPKTISFETKLWRLADEIRKIKVGE